MRICLYLFFILFISCSKKQTVTTSIVQQQIVLDTTTSKPQFNFSDNQILHKDIIPEERYKNYWSALNEIRGMLEGKEKLNFKKAVFLTENSFYDSKLNYADFNAEIARLAEICKAWSKANGQSLKYEFDDFDKVLMNCAIYTVITDTIWFAKDIPLNYPYTYDFNDFFGGKDWSKMFVTKLLYTKSGNCHSLPYLYKILAEELETNAHLSFAPNHIYIKHKNKKIGMYNTELTSAEFPIDAWLMCSGYISTDAIINEIYMDTLSLQESVAYTLVDLAKGYEKKFGRSDTRFIIESLNLCLKYFPNSINALLLKAETEKGVAELLMKRYNIDDPVRIREIPEISEAFINMERTYQRIVSLGYREMPEKMYTDWLVSLKGQDGKYINRKINNIFKNN